MGKHLENVVCTLVHTSSPPVHFFLLYLFFPFGDLLIHYILPSSPFFLTHCNLPSTSITPCSLQDFLPVILLLNVVYEFQAVFCVIVGMLTTPSIWKIIYPFFLWHHILLVLLFTLWPLLLHPFCKPIFLHSFLKCWCLIRLCPRPFTLLTLYGPSG